MAREREREGRDEYQGGEIGEGRGRAADRGGEHRYGGAPRESGAGVSGYDDSFEGGTAADDPEGGRRRGEEPEGQQFDEDRFTSQLGLQGGARIGETGFVGQGFQRDPDGGTIDEDQVEEDPGRSRGPSDGVRDAGRTGDEAETGD